MVSRRTFLTRTGQLALSLAGSAFLHTQQPSLRAHAHAYAHANGQIPNTPSMPPLRTPLHPSLQIPDDAPIEVKIGQMVLAGFGGQYLDEQSLIVQEIRQKHLGGVVLFRNNIAAPVQLQTLTRTLQAAAQIPLLISTDQEGGFVNRLGNDFGLTSNYSESYLGARDDVETTRAQAYSTAQILAQMGINLNLAPVVDLNLNPANPIIARFERSYSADPAIVVKHARAAIEAHRYYNVLCMLKHFPGHGSATGDTHSGFVDVTQRWNESELQPFAELSKANECDAIMTAHIYNANLDRDRPATLSRNIITGILRQRIGFGGVIMTDDMHMRAIAGHYPIEDAVFYAIDAGVDILAVSNNIPSSKALSASRAVEILQRLVANGRISPERIDQSYQRIKALKGKMVRSA